MKIIKRRENRVIECQQCQQDFVWTKGEQEFYKEKDLKPPARCPVCRATFKEAEKDKFRGRLKPLWGRSRG